MNYNLARRVVAEALGTAILLAAVVGSGIMAERLSGGNIAIALLANTIATMGIYVAGKITGAHLNPAVTLSLASQSEISWRDAVAYICAQLFGAAAGVATANLMFSLPAIFVSRHARGGAGQIISEFVATFGLVLVIQSCAKLQPRLVAFAVGAYITAAYWFTASTSFANPAVTVARSLTDTFTGIRPVDVPLFLLAQLFGATAATVLTRWLIPIASPGSSND